MTVITYDDFPDLREKYSDKKLVLATGSFDLVHAGHALFFEDCKKYGDALVVVVAGDEIIRKYKGEKRPIMNEAVRLKMVDSLKPVDYTALDRFSQDGPHLLYALEVALNQLRPDYYIVNEDGFDMDIRRGFCKKVDSELVILERACPESFGNISTSKIIEKIKSL